MSVALPSDDSEEEDSGVTGSAAAAESRPAMDLAPLAGAATTTAAPPASHASANTAAAACASGRAGPDSWLMGLFSASLFEAHGCRCHPGSVRNGAVKRNENNQYCLDCTHAHGTGMCKLCLPGHAACCSGRIFQIRKYM